MYVNIKSRVISLSELHNIDSRVTHFCLLRSLHGSHGLWFDGSKLTSTVPVCVLPRLRPADLAPGCVRIVDLE